ncbi:S1/P1 nuclease [Hyphomonas sp.]|uniref:S1/P1 nuclease n=1 Tax=Hyphomonas sp. TaxID=87 RepID=UPI0025BCF217|nr:S1/P1 nuclease [Hyphomonas sp.]
MFRLIASLTAAALLAFPAAAWGKTGHRIVGEVATHYLSAPAEAAVREILGPEGLAEASDWPDYMRSNPDAFWRSEANPWHYVTIPEGMTYAETTPPEAGDAITALTKFRAIVLDEEASLDDRQLALRFIVHLVGDLQQPLHAGNGKDRGGNWVDVVFFEEMSNLHEVWDEKLIQYEELSYTEWAAWLVQKITPADLGEWGRATPAQWADESAAIRDTIYPETEILSYDYAYMARPILNRQMSKGGVRLAAYLNAMFDPAPGVAGTD